jgi:ubiquitin C-terminal hydrolase
MGERSWLDGAKEQALERTATAAHIIPVARKPGMPVGLRNLGATCYVASLMMAWFHNPAMRHAVLAWRAAPDAAAGDVALAALQRLFVQLALTSEGSVNPGPYVDALRLQRYVQQDAHEFCKLLLSLHERALGATLQPEFSGLAAYETLCRGCGATSRRPEAFTELQLDVHTARTLEAALRLLFHAEELSGDNQYHCSYCANRCDATRRFALSALPRTLSLHLLRFRCGAMNGWFCSFFAVAFSGH